MIARLLMCLAVPMTMAVAGCAYESKAPPVSTAVGRGPQSQMPQSPNSLPLGSAVVAPLDRSQVNAVRVGP